MRFLCFLSILILLSSCKFWDSISGIIKHPVKNIAIVDIPYSTNINHSSITYYYYYYVNGIKYSGSRVYTNNCEEIGSAYEMVYDSIYPNFSELHLCKPLFLNDDAVDTTTGIVHDYDKRVVEYNYMLEGEKITKLQVICPDTLAKYKDIIKVGNTFLVKYNVFYPKVAILYFDKLIKVADTPPTTH